MTITLIVLAVFIALNFGRIYYQNGQVPVLGVENGELKPISSKPNNVSTQAEDPEKNVATLPMKSTVEETIAAIKAALNEYGGAEIQQEQSDYIYAIFTTNLMKYRDDAEFWIDTENREVHFRSASRAGYSDMGLNRKRYEALTELYTAQ